MKIKLYKESIKCPNCKLNMKFEKETHDLEFYGEDSDRGHKLVLNAEIYSCPKCFNIYEVKR